MRQFQQQILPADLAGDDGLGLRHRSAGAEQPRADDPQRAVADDRGAAGSGRCASSGSTSSRTAYGNYLPHLLPVDQTLHWANPPGGATDRDSRPTFTATPGRYTGPVPIVTHVHGAIGVADESDGYAEAWYLPAANEHPRRATPPRGPGTTSSRTRPAASYGVSWGPGFATFQYPNDNRASTIWYHDHALGMTRLNVYAGPAGFYIVRGGPAGDDKVLDTRTGAAAALPGPAPRENDKFPPEQALLRDPDRDPGPLLQRRTVRCSIPTAASSSTGSCATTSRTASSRRSGTRSSSATRSWSTATPGRS